MKSIAILAALVVAASGCTNTTARYPRDTSELPDKDTRTLCRIVAENPDQVYRVEAAKLLVQRGADFHKCRRLISADNAIITGIAIAGAATAAGVAANNGYGGYYVPSGYGPAWDRFYNGQWRCRDRATGRFLPDYRCGHLPMIDNW